MIDLYEDIRINKKYIKIEAGELLFAEYTCPLEEKNVSIWTHTDYIVHVVSGKKVWHTADGDWSAESGQTLFFKKGGAVVEQYFDEDFCLLLFFIPDDFIRNVVAECSKEINLIQSLADPACTALRVNNDAALQIYFKTMLTYFAGLEKPSEALVKLKLKELLLNIIFSNNNPELKNYFLSFINNKKPPMSEIMENNFKYNLSLENFAELCHRSLSSFKRDFYKLYNETPGKWLLNKRLDYAAVLLRSGNLNISQVVFESGFENISHFSHAFKTKFGVSPSKFQEQQMTAV